MKSIVVACALHFAQMYLYSVITSSLPTRILGEAMPCTVVAPRFGRVSPVFLFARLTAETCTLVALALCDNVFVAMRAPELYDRWFFIFMPAPVLLAAGSRTELLINAS